MMAAARGDRAMSSISQRHQSSRNDFDSPRYVLRTGRVGVCYMLCGIIFPFSSNLVQFISICCFSVRYLLLADADSLHLLLK